MAGGKGRSRLVLTGLAAFVLLALLLSLTTSSTVPHYVLVVDAGSSGTRIYAYIWHPGSHAGQLPVLQALPPSAAADKIPRKQGKGMYHRVETMPGLSAYADDAAGMEQQALGPLLTWARAVVPRAQWPCTPVYLLATAGVRKLGEKSQVELMDNSRRVLQNSGFRFEPEWAKIISGADEGVYGWVSLNYAKGHLQHPKDSSPKDTWGTLDMGGSSLEVTFEGAAGPLAPGQALTNITLASKPVHLYTQTLKRYGLSDTFDRSVTALLQAWKSREPRPSDPTHKSDSTVPAGPLPALGDKVTAAVAPITTSDHAIVESHTVSTPGSTTAGAGIGAPMAAATTPAPTSSGTGSTTSNSSIAAGEPDVPLHTAATVGNATASDIAATTSGSRSPKRTNSDELDEIIKALRTIRKPPSSTQSPLTSAALSSPPAAHQLSSPPMPATNNESRSTQVTQPSAISAVIANNTEGSTILSTNTNTSTTTITNMAATTTAHTAVSSSLGVPGVAKQDPPHQGIPGHLPADVPQRQAASNTRRSTAELDPPPAQLAGQSAGSSQLPSAVVAGALLQGQSVDHQAASHTTGRRVLSLRAHPPLADPHPTRQLAPAADIRDRRLAELGTEPPRLVVLAHPCLHSGFNRTYARQHNYDVLPGHVSTRLVGLPDVGACHRLAMSLVHYTMPCLNSRESCASELPQHELKGNYMALAGFYVVWKFLKLPPSATTSQLVDATHRFCGMPWKLVEAELGEHVNVEKYCLWGLYVANLLTVGFKLKDQQINIGDFAWPMGAALTEGSKLPALSRQVLQRPPLLSLLMPRDIHSSQAADKCMSGHTELIAQEAKLLLLLLASVVLLYVCYIRRPGLHRFIHQQPLLPVVKPSKSAAQLGRLVGLD